MRRLAIPRIVRSCLDRIQERYLLQSTIDEDATVLRFLSGLPSSSALEYLEVGSGLGRFPLLVLKRFPRFNITCIEKNRQLANMTTQAGLNTITGDFTAYSFPADSYDVIHCSHVIEHLAYPDIASALNKLAAVTRPKGFVIIRSPLMHQGFYNDLDHIRPYPPEAILSFFANPQQQLVGDQRVREVLRWYRREAVVFASGSKLKSTASYVMKSAYCHVGFPRAKPNGFVLILQRL